MKRKKFLTIVGLLALFLSTPLLVTASGLATFDVKYPQGEELSKEVQVIYSANGGGYETICAKTSQSLDCDIVGQSLHNGIDLLWGDQGVFDVGRRQVAILTTDKGIFLMVIDNGLVDIDQIIENSPYIGEIEKITIIENYTIIETPQPTPSPTENKCGHFGPHYGTPVNGDSYFCQGGN